MNARSSSTSERAVARLRAAERGVLSIGCVLLCNFGPQDDDPARALFLANCASCHGENGDGKGTTELDRPARSFKDGGFSYGNTPEALFRTISMGIPGTPMPGFDSSLTEEERRAVAAYVVTLGPEVRDVTTEETILEVQRRPLVVRGMLPAISDKGIAHPRGLLIGTTSGLTFEYRVDDVRLLGVRQGGFVERTDWTGRGGSALRPLGKLVFLVQGGTPEPPFLRLADERADPLRGHLESTWVRGDRVGLTYRLEQESGAVVGQVRESMAAFGDAVGSGFERRFDVWGFEAPTALVIDLVHAGPSEAVASFRVEDAAGLRAPRTWTILERENEVVECVGFLVMQREPIAIDDGPKGHPGRFTLELQPDDSITIHTLTIVAPAWSDELRDGLAHLPFP